VDAKPRVRSWLGSLSRPVLTAGGGLLAALVVSAPAWAWCPSVQLIVSQSSTVQAGGQVTLTITAPEANTAQVPIFLDTQDGADTNQIAICKVNGSQPTQCTVTIPAQTAPGTYYLGGIEQDASGHDIGYTSGCGGPELKVLGPTGQLPEVPYAAALPGMMLAVGVPLVLRRRRRRVA
jgi:hypothetical protein